MSLLAELVDAARARAKTIAVAPACDRIPPPCLADALRGKDELSIIAEIKRKSPSRGELSIVDSPGQLARSLVAAGAVALSVLTEETRFGGSLADLREVAGAVQVPVMMKDFVVDERQIAAAGASGASAVLLIVRALSRSELERLLQATRSAGIEALVECHDEVEVRLALDAGAELVGVNNRDLEHLEIDLRRAEALLPLVPEEVIAVAESGYATPEDLATVRGKADAVLVGSALMTHDDPAQALTGMLA